MTHLGERVCDLVDGQVSPEAAERALAHLAGCRACRDLVEAERLTKARLAALQVPDPGEVLIGRLMAMGGPAGPHPPRSGHVPGSPRPKPVPVGRSRRPGGTARPAGAPTGRGAVRRTGRRRLAVAVMGALGAVGAGVAVLAAASPFTASTVMPAVDTFVVRQALTSARLPVLDIPVGWRVTRRAAVGTARGGVSGP